MNALFNALDRNQVAAGCTGIVATAGDTVLHAIVALDPLLSFVTHVLSVVIGLLTVRALWRKRLDAAAVDIAD